MKPILFSADMVRAILKGRKTQTRRVVKLPEAPFRDVKWHPDWQNEAWADRGGFAAESYLKVPALVINENERTVHRIFSKYEIGQKLWVRESWRVLAGFDNVKPSELNPDVQVFYGAGSGNVMSRLQRAHAGKKRPSIFMPRWASRITLEITDVRVERLQGISNEDAKAEGVDHTPQAPAALNHRTAFKGLWDSINGDTYPWDSNPWVWVVEFKSVNQH